MVGPDGVVSLIATMADIRAGCGEECLSVLNTLDRIGPEKPATWLRVG